MCARLGDSLTGILPSEAVGQCNRLKAELLLPYSLIYCREIGIQICLVYDQPAIDATLIARVADHKSSFVLSGIHSGGVADNRQLAVEVGIFSTDKLVSDRLLLAVRIRESIVCDIEAQNLLLNSGNGKLHSHGVIIGVVGCEDSVSRQACHIVDNPIGLLPRPRTKELSNKLYVRKLILKCHFSKLGNGNLHITLQNSKYTVLNIIVYIIVGICDAYTKFACLRCK